MRRLLGDDDADDDDSSSLWWVGVILCLAGSIGLNLGNNLQSFGLQGPGTDSTDAEKMSDASTIVKTGNIKQSAGYMDANLEEEDDEDENGQYNDENSIVNNCDDDNNNDDDDDDRVSVSASTLSRSTHNAHEKEETGGVKKPMYNQGIFFFGTGLFITGSLLTFVAFGFAAQSLLASLEGVQFVSNIIFGKFFRNADISCSILFGVAMIVAGIAVVVLNGSHESESFTSQELMMLYVNNHGYQAFLVVAGGSAVLLRYTEKAFTKRQLQGRPWPYSEVMIPLTFAVFSAIFGTQSVVQAKCLMMCLTLTLDHQNQFDHPFTYAMLAAWLVFVGVWLTRMGIALERFDPMFIIPLLQVSFILLAIISGGIFFEEFDTFGVTQTIAFCGGVLLVCLGLYFLTPPQKDKNNKTGAIDRSDNFAGLSQSESSDNLFPDAQVSPLVVGLDNDKAGNTANLAVVDQFDRKGIRNGLNSPIVQSSSTNQEGGGHGSELPRWDLAAKEQEATRVLEEESGFYDLGLGGRADYFNVDILLMHQLDQVGKGIQTAAHLATDAVSAVGEVMVDDFVLLAGKGAASVNMMSQFTSHVVEEPEATVGAAGKTVSAAVGSVGGWLRTMKNGEVDWKATTAQLNLIAAAQAHESMLEKKKTKMKKAQRNKKQKQHLNPYMRQAQPTLPSALPSIENSFQSSSENIPELGIERSGGGRGGPSGGGGFSHRHIPDRSTYRPPQLDEDEDEGGQVFVTPSTMISNLDKNSNASLV